VEGEEGKAEIIRVENIGSFLQEESTVACIVITGRFLIVMVDMV
jgi:hypothetical protein